MKSILLEPSPVAADGGRLIGRDPRRIAADEFDRAGIASAPAMAVIRAKCLDCCVGQADEVRKCVAVRCPNWPYRMGVNPFRALKLPAEERARRGAGLTAAKEAKKAAPRDFKAEKDADAH
jgi:hypothetical protein